MIELHDCTTALDNFAIGMFLTCRRKFKYRILDSLVPLRHSVALSYGSAIHAALAAYYLGDDPFAAFVSQWDDRLADDKRNTLAAFAMLIDYTRHYGSDTLRPLHVEVGFQIELAPSIDYRGRIDLIAEDQQTGWLVVVDHKTASRKPLSGDCKDRQISGYILAVQEILQGCRCHGGILNYLVTVKDPDPSKRFYRKYSSRVPWQLDEWRMETISIVNDIRSCTSWYRNTGACGYFSGCEYLDLCTVPTSTRDAVIETQYGVQPWEPYNDEGEVL